MLRGQGWQAEELLPPEGLYCPAAQVVATGWLAVMQDVLPVEEVVWPERQAAQLAAELEAEV